MYSASAVLMATTACLLLLHDTAPPLSMNAYPDVLLHAQWWCCIMEQQEAGSSGHEHG